MASGALLRRRKSSELLESRAFSSFTRIPSQEKDSKKNDDAAVMVNGDSLKISALGLFRSSCYRNIASGHGNGKPEFGFIIGPRTASQFIRYASTATAGQPNLDGDDENNEELVAKKRKEASAEDCDQAVVGLSSAKAKAKAKRLQESQNVALTILRRVWRTILGIGPALRAVAAMSRDDWAMKLVHWKNEFVSTLQHYWLGIKLLGADVRISFRLLVKLARGKSLSRRERQQLTRTTEDIFRLVPVAIFIVVPFMEFLLPVFLKLFPNMLPSTFQDKMKEQVLVFFSLWKH